MKAPNDIKTEANIMSNTILFNNFDALHLGRYSY